MQRKTWPRERAFDVSIYRYRSCAASKTVFEVHLTNHWKQRFLWLEFFFQSFSEAAISALNFPYHDIVRQLNWHNHKQFNEPINDKMFHFISLSVGVSTSQCATATNYDFMTVVIMLYGKRAAIASILYLINMRYLNRTVWIQTCAAHSECCQCLTMHVNGFSLNSFNGKPIE